MRLLELRWLAVLLILAGIVAHLSIRPSNDRDWAADQVVLPWAEIDGREINDRARRWADSPDFSTRIRQPV
jgi:hypothetical protein